MKEVHSRATEDEQYTVTHMIVTILVNPTSNFNSDDDVNDATFVSNGYIQC